LATQSLIAAERLAIEKKTIERRIEDVGPGARMGCKRISSSPAVFEKCHRKYGISRVVGGIEQADEVKGSRDIAAFYGWIFELNIPLDLLCFRYHALSLTFMYVSFQKR
jgi:hypothetical protein